MAPDWTLANFPEAIRIDALRRTTGDNTARTWPPAGYPIATEWAPALTEIAAAGALPYEPVFGTLELDGYGLLAAVASLGATIEPIPGYAAWAIGDQRGSRQLFDRELAHLMRSRVYVSGFKGAFTFELDGERYLAANPDLLFRDPIVVGARSLNALLDVCDRLRIAIGDAIRDRVQLMGSGGMMREEFDIGEDDLVLDSELKTDLLRYVNGFERMVGAAQQAKTTVHRGLLLVGPPGTGKTMTVRHLLTRFRHFRRYIYLFDGNVRRLDESAFVHLVESLNLHPRPAIVVLEDVDRLLEQQVITPQYLLNVLDGVLRPSASVLWVATSNDPSQLEANLLDRPGRFDRIFVFERPAREERAGLIRRFLGMDAADEGGELVAEIAARSEGLTGAHLRELCETAIIMAGEEPGALELHLRRELDRILDQHHDSARPTRWVPKAGKVGFGVA